MLGLDVLGTGARVTHGVDHDDEEPQVPRDQQPASHQVDLLQLDVSLRAQYGFSDAWALELALPIGTVVTDAEFRDAAGAVMPSFASIHHRDETIGGVGDMQVSARWLALSQAPFSLELRAGVSLPFGEVVEDPYALGDAGKPHRHQFLGTGTFDPLIGLDATWSLSDDFDLSLWSSARLPLYAGPKGHRASRAIAGGASLGTGVGDVSFQLGPEARWESTAEWSGRTAENSGRTDLLVSAGVYWQPAALIQLFFAAKVPVWLDAVGSQVTQPVIGAIGARYALDL